MTLRATTALGDNTVPILSDLVAQLQRDGLDIEFDQALEPGEREELVRAGAADIVWACGLLTVQLIDDGLDLEVVAAPVFAGEPGPVYRSVIVVGADTDYLDVSETLGGRLAINEHGSWSGCWGFTRWLEDEGLTVEAYRTEVLTGSHRNSVLAVAEGVADVAAIDHTVWEHLAGTEPAAERVRVLARTGDWPAPPFSVRRGDPQGLAGVVAQLRPPGLDRIVPTTAGTYYSMRSSGS